MGHNNNLFKEVLQFIPIHEFQEAVDSYEGDKRTRELKFWGQFVMLLFEQLTQYDLQHGKGLEQPKYSSILSFRFKYLKKTTLSDINESRMR